MLYSVIALRIVAAVDADLERRLARAAASRSGPMRSCISAVWLSSARAASALPVATGSVASASTSMAGFSPRRAVVCWTRPAPRCRTGSPAGSRSAARPAAATSPTRASRRTCSTAGTSPATPIVRDEDGYFCYQARTDDMIISAGYNIAGPEVEEALLSPPGRGRVRRRRRAGRGTRQIVKAAFVVLRPGVDRRRGEGGRAAGAGEAADRAVQVPAGHRVRDPSCRAPATGKLQRFRLRERWRPA